MAISKHKKLPQDGFAALLVSIIMVIVLGLLTVGFINLVNSSKENALNRQLNNDAYYAAESGVNDAINAIEHGYNQKKTNCNPVPNTDPYYAYLGNNNVNGPQDKYSCLLINPQPDDLQYSSVDANQPIVAILSTVDSSYNPSNAGSIEISWEPSPQTNPPYYFADTRREHFPCTRSITGPCLPPQSSWISRTGHPLTGILRLSLTPLYQGAPLPTDTSTTYTAFLYPWQGVATHSIDATYWPSGPHYNIGQKSGVVLSGDCKSSNVPDACSVSLDLSKSEICGTGCEGYLMTLRSLYLPSQVTIQAYKNSGHGVGSQLLFNNGQTLIDSTGYDHGVYKRIQVRIPSMNYAGLPGYDMASVNTICKDLVAFPGNSSTNNPGSASSSCGL